jgi:hypothetical protein
MWKCIVLFYPEGRYCYFYLLNREASRNRKLWFFKFKKNYRHVGIEILHTHKDPVKSVLSSHSYLVVSRINKIQRILIKLKGTPWTGHCTSLSSAHGDCCFLLARNKFITSKSNHRDSILSLYIHNLYPSTWLEFRSVGRMVFFLISHSYYILVLTNLQLCISNDTK